MKMHLGSKTMIPVPNAGAQISEMKALKMLNLYLEDTMTMIAPVSVTWVGRQNHVGWRIDENTSGSGKMGKGYTEFLLPKSLKCK